MARLTSWFLLLSFVASGTANAESPWRFRNCNWSDVSVQQIKEQKTREAVEKLTSNLYNCAYSGINDSRSKGEAEKAKAFECYVGMLKGISWSHTDLEIKTGEELSNDILDYRKQLTDSNCAKSGDEEIDHLAELFIAGVNAFAEKREPFAKAQEIADAKSAVVRKKAEAAQRIKSSSKSCKAAKLKRDYCQTMQVVQIFERKIEHEQKVGARSGYVNSKGMRDWTSSQINMEDKASEINESYKALMGLGLARSECNLKNGTHPEKVELGTDFETVAFKACGTDD